MDPMYYLVGNASSTHGGSRPSTLVARGFTLVELLVVITVISVLVMLLLPAVNSVRSTARRAQCTNNMVQMIVAVQNYEEAHEVYPAGTINNTGPIQSQPLGFHHSWLVQLLPYVEEKSLHRSVDRSVGVYHANNKGPRQLLVSAYKCPSSNAWFDIGWSDYAGVHHDVEAPIDDDNHGVFFLNSATRYEDITDGVGQTLFIGEKYAEATDLGWMSGTRATLRNTGTPLNRTGKNAPGVRTPLLPREEVDEYGYSIEADESPPPVNGEAVDDQVTGEENGADASDTAAAAADGNGPAAAAAPLLYVGGFGSEHAGGANFAFGNGRVKFLGSDIDRATYEQLGHRADGKLLDARKIGR